MNFDLYEEEGSEDSDAKALEAYNSRMNDLMGGAGKGDLRTLVFDGPTKGKGKYKGIKMPSQS